MRIAKERQVNPRFSTQQAEGVNMLIDKVGSETETLREILTMAVTDTEHYIPVVLPSSGDMSGKEGVQMCSYLHPWQYKGVRKLTKDFGFTINQIFRFAYDILAGGKAGLAMKPILKMYLDPNEKDG